MKKSKHKLIWNPHYSRFYDNRPSKYPIGVFVTCKQCTKDNEHLKGFNRLGMPMRLTFHINDIPFLLGVISEGNANLLLSKKDPNLDTATKRAASRCYYLLTKTPHLLEEYENLILEILTTLPYEKKRAVW